MADKAISQLNAATSVNSLDLFVLEQSGEAKKLTGQILENWLVSFADGHGGIQSISKTSTSGTNPVVDTYTITYADETTSTFTVTNGVKGDTGAQTYVWIKYSENYPTADSDMSSSPDNWMGVYAGTASTAPAHYTDYVWFEIKGETGETGAAATITAATVGYQQSDSGAVVPEGSWTTTVPSPVAGKFLWTRIQIQFNTGSPITAYSVSRYGIDGTGAVSSVNSVSPDQYGNVQLVAGDIQALDSQSVQAHLDDDEQDIADLKTSVSQLRPTQKHLILMGDSYSINDAWTGWIAQFKSITNYDVVAESGVGGSGFIGAPDIPTVYQQLSGLTIANPNEITDIVILGGYNDASASYYYGATESDFKTAIDAVASYAKGRFINAKIHYGFIGVDEHDNGYQTVLNATCKMLERRCGEAGISFIPNANYILLNHDYILQGSSTNAKSHPNSTGTMVVAQYLDDYLSSGYFDIKYGFSYNGLSIYVKNGELTAFPQGYVFSQILPAMTFPFNTWTTIADASGTSGNILWGTHDDGTCFKFWGAVFSNGGQYVTHALFRIYDKQIQINPLNSTSGLTLTGVSWICIDGFKAPFESMYG